VADFYCPKLRLVVEIDGDSHYSDEAAQYDAKRTNYFHTQGITVLRFTNEEVMKNIEGVLESIVDTIPHP